MGVSIDTGGNTSLRPIDFLKSFSSTSGFGIKAATRHLRRRHPSAVPPNPAQRDCGDIRRDCFPQARLPVSQRPEFEDQVAFEYALYSCMLTSRYCFSEKLQVFGRVVFAFFQQRPYHFKDEEAGYKNLNGVPIGSPSQGSCRPGCCPGKPFPLELHREPHPQGCGGARSLGLSGQRKEIGFSTLIYSGI